MGWRLSIINRQKKTLKGFYDEIAKRSDGFYNRPGDLAEKFQVFVLRIVVSALYNGGWLLDVGCGRGRYLGQLVDRGFTYVGLDSSKEMLKIAKNKACQRAESSVFLIQGDAEHLPFVNSLFNSVICIDVLHHFTSKDSRKNVVRELARVLKPDGEIVIEMKNKLNLVYWLLSKANPSGTVQPVTPFEIESYLKTFGCVDVRAKGVMFPSPWLSPLVILQASRLDAKRMNETFCGLHSQEACRQK